MLRSHDSLRSLALNTSFLRHNSSSRGDRRLLQALRMHRWLSVSIDHLIALRLVLRLWVYFFYLMDSSVHEFFFRKNGFEYCLSVVQIKSVQILSFYFLFGGYVSSIESSELRNFEEDLKPVVFSVLNIVKTKIKFCKFLQVFNRLKLSYSADIVMAQE